MFLVVKELKMKKMMVKTMERREELQLKFLQKWMKYRSNKKNRIKKIGLQLVPSKKKMGYKIFLFFSFFILIFI